MEHTEAFKAAREKWSNLEQNGATAQATTSSAQSGEPVFLAPMDNPPSLEGPVAVAHSTVGQEMSRIATAMEKIAEYMPQLVAALQNSSAAPPTPASLAVGQSTVAPVASDASNGVVASGNAAASTSSYVAPSQATYDTAASASSSAAPVPPGFSYASPADAEVGVISVNSDSEDDVDPSDKCGVCHGPCNKSMLALDCGHYPFCGRCVKALTKKADSPVYKCKCPICNKLVYETIVLHLE